MILKADPQKLASPALMWGIVIAGIMFLSALFKYSGTEGVYVLSSPIFLNKMAWILFVPALFYWIYFFTGAIGVHKEAAKSVSGITKLIKTGVYSLVRHPIYSADLVLSWGVFFLHPDYFVLFCVLWTDAVLLSWMKIEEKFLLQKFGRDYKDYMEEVPMFIPGIKKRLIAFIFFYCFFERVHEIFDVYSR